MAENGERRWGGLQGQGEERQSRKNERERDAQSLKLPTSTCADIIGPSALPFGRSFPLGGQLCPSGASSRHGPCRRAGTRPVRRGTLLLLLSAYIGNLRPIRLLFAILARQTFLLIEA